VFIFKNGNTCQNPAKMKKIAGLFSFSKKKKKEKKRKKYLLDLGLLAMQCQDGTTRRWIMQLTADCGKRVPFVFRIPK
jgi:hypothetical protein